MLLVTKGQHKAFEALYERYHARLHFFAVGYVGDREQAADIVQDVFMKIIERPENFDVNKKFTTWVYTVTANACKNALRNESNRSRIRERVAGDNDYECPPDTSVKDKQLLSETIKRVLEELSEKERLVYLLRFEQELSILDIAAIANIPAGSVKSCIFYMLKKFEQRLKHFSL
jgi:RNA polymerase sigma-70 factor (ECF subfamily)